MKFELNNNNKKTYEIIKTTFVLEQNTTIYELLHKQTKAKIVLFENDDDNKVFSICFKTPVDNEKGIPHILEHSVLCGSRKFNVKDPFVELAKSSLNTFLNAMTYPDKTIYPIASTNFKDYCNLMDVYLDAVFFPNIYKNKKIFLQEGWHYEFDNDNNLIANGVVLNEMKGVFSDPDGLLENAILKSLYDGTNYSFETGGDPSHIVNLTYEEFLNFHKKLYNPTNSIIMLYGDIDFNERIEYINNEYLSKFDFNKEYIINFEDYKFEKNIKQYNNINFYKDYYANDKTNKTSIVSYNFSLPKNKNALDSIVLNILDYILFVQEGAILKQKIEQLNICDSINSICEFSLQKGFFSIVAHNIDSNDMMKFVNVIDKEINNILTNGIDKEKLLSGINIIRFQKIENETNGPVGLNMILSSLDSYLYNQDIDIFLKYKKEFEIIDNEILENKNNIFYKKLKQIFIENNEKSIALIEPDKNLIINKNNESKKILLDKQKQMTKEQIENIKKELDDLKFYQSSDYKEDLSSIPKLNIDDIDRQKNIASFKIKQIKNKNVIVTNKKMNSLLYMNFNFRLDDFNEIDKYIIGVLSLLLTKINTKNYSYEELNVKIDQISSVFTPKLIATENEKYFSFFIKTLNNNINKNIDIIFEIFESSDFSDKNRIYNILKEVLVDSNMSITTAGHISSYTRCSSNISNFSEMNDKMTLSGISFNIFLNKILNEFDKYYEDLICLLNHIIYKIIKTKNLFFDVCIDEEDYNLYEKSIENFVDRFNEINIYKMDDNLYNETINRFINVDEFARKNKKEAFLIKSDVNFISRCGVFDKNKYNGSLSVLKTMISLDYLWTNIRVLGGAYGQGVRFDKMGVGSFFTYRDPNVKKSDKVFIDVVDYIKNINISKEDLEKYIIGAIGTFDTPKNKTNEHLSNVSYFLNNYDNIKLNKFRCEILDTTIENIKNDIDVLKEIIETNEICALISEKNIEEAKEYYINVEKLN